MKNLLLAERWRPKTMDEVILLPRVRALFENGINSNFLFHGTFGSGKTTLARILIGKYSKTSPHIEINSSFHTSIDTLRSKIDEFCSKVHMGFDLDIDSKPDDIKYVFLDEFDRTSIQYQDALKAYIEDYSSKNVRFILTTNHLNKISPGIRSRVVEVNFDCVSGEEEKYLKREIYKKIMNQICIEEKITIDKNDLVKIINRNFPDFRSIMMTLDNFRITGNVDFLNQSQVSQKLKDEVFDLIMKQKIDYETIYHFFIENFGNDGVENFFKILGRPFVDYLISKKINLDKIFKSNYIVCDYSSTIDKCTDPVILGMTVIGKLRDLLAQD